MGAGSTISAAIALGYKSIGIELDPTFFSIAQKAIPELAALPVNGASRNVKSNGVVSWNGKQSDRGLFA